MTEFNIVTDHRELNQALFNVTHGLYILTARQGERVNGQCLDAAMQVTNAPPRVTIGVGKRSLTHEMIADSGRFVVNVLDREDESCPATIKTFGFQSGRDVDKFDGVSYEKSEHGLPILPSSVAFLECAVVPEWTLDLGTHSLFTARVEQAGVREGGRPLTYNEYRDEIRRRRIT